MARPQDNSFDENKKTQLLQSLEQIKAELDQIEKEAGVLRTEAHKILDKERTKDILEKIIKDL